MCARLCVCTCVSGISMSVCVCWQVSQGIYLVLFSILFIWGGRLPTPTEVWAESLSVVSQK